MSTYEARVVAEHGSKRKESWEFRHAGAYVDVLLLWSQSDFGWLWLDFSGTFSPVFGNPGFTEALSSDSVVILLSHFNDLALISPLSRSLPRSLAGFIPFSGNTAMFCRPITKLLKLPKVIAGTCPKSHQTKANERQVAFGNLFFGPHDDEMPSAKASICQLWSWDNLDHHGPIQNIHYHPLAQFEKSPKTFAIETLNVWDCSGQANICYVLEVYHTACINCSLSISRCIFFFFHLIYILYCIYIRLMLHWPFLRAQMWLENAGWTHGQSGWILWMPAFDQSMFKYRFLKLPFWL